MGNPMLWWILGSTVIIGGTVALITSKPAASSKGDGGKLGGATFDGKSYSDASVTEGELAEAAAHGDEAARTELARREQVRVAHAYCESMGLGDSCDSYVKAGFDVTNAIRKSVYEDLAETANSPEQKARLADVVAKIVSLGFPPTRFTSLMEFGVEEQADTIEEDISFIEHGETYNAPFIGELSISRELSELGKAATFTATQPGPARDRLNQLFGALAMRRSVVGVMRLERPVYLFDYPVTRDSLAKAGLTEGESLGHTHAMLAYLAAAGAGRFNMPLDVAYQMVADNASTFNTRYGLTERAQTLSTDAFLTDKIVVSEGGPCILTEAWFGLVRRASEAGYVDQLPTKTVYKSSGGAVKFSPFART